MKIEIGLLCQILLLFFVALAWILDLRGVISSTIALLIMGVGVGILFLLSERKTKFHWWDQHIFLRLLPLA